MRKQLLLSIIAVMTIMALLSGCVSVTPPDTGRMEEPPPVEAPPADNSADYEMTPDIQGKIIEVDEEGGLRILVDANGTLEHSVKGKIWVSIPDDVIYAKGVKKDFTVDNTIAIVSNGQIMESDPMQTTATQIQQNYGPDEEPAPHMEQAESIPKD